nr:MAG TPA: hypothetical protein [Siphoviridae sp. ctX8T1]
MDEDKIHFLGSPSTLGIAGRLPIVVAAIIIAGKRIKTGRHEGSGSAPCWIYWVKSWADWARGRQWVRKICQSLQSGFVRERSCRARSLDISRWARGQF